MKFKVKVSSFTKIQHHKHQGETTAKQQRTEDRETNIAGSMFKTTRTKQLLSRQYYYRQYMLLVKKHVHYMGRYMTGNG